MEMSLVPGASVKILSAQLQSELEVYCCKVVDCGLECAGKYQLLDGGFAYFCYGHARISQLTLKRNGNPVLVSFFTKNKTTMECIEELFKTEFK